jgi:hypothetical protein
MMIEHQEKELVACLRRFDLREIVFLDEKIAQNRISLPCCFEGRPLSEFYACDVVLRRCGNEAFPLDGLLHAVYSVTDASYFFWKRERVMISRQADPAVVWAAIHVCWPRTLRE